MGSAGPPTSFARELPPLPTYAIKVRLNDIRYAGGWFTKSTVLEFKYVDFTMRPTKAALLFFGYLKKDYSA